MADREQKFRSANLHKVDRTLSAKPRISAQLNLRDRARVDSHVYQIIHKSDFEFVPGLVATLLASFSPFF